MLQSARRREVSMWILCRSIFGRNLRFFVLHQISYIGREIWFCYGSRRTGCERLSLDLDLRDHGFLRESRINSQILFLVHFLQRLRKPRCKPGKISGSIANLFSHATISFSKQMKRNHKKKDAIHTTQSFPHIF